MARSATDYGSRVLDALTTRIAIVDETGTIIAVNAAWQAFARHNGGDDRTCGVGASYIQACDRAAPDEPDAAIVAHGLRDVLQRRRDLFEHVYVCWGERQASWFRERITPIEEDGKSFAVISHEDITRERAAEQALSESLARYAGLAETSPDAVFVNREDRVVFANGALLNLVGAHSMAEVIGRPIFDFFLPDDHELVRQRIARIRESRRPAPMAEERIVRLDGRIVPVEVVAAAFQDGLDTSIHVVLRDITARKQTLHALNAERRRLSALLTALPDYVWMKDVAGRFVFGSASFSKLLGTPPAAYLGHTDADFFTAETVERFREMATAAIAGDPITSEDWITAPGGGRIRLETAKAAVRDDDGTLLGVLGIARDVTAVRATAEALRESEREMRLALDAAQLGTWKHILSSNEIFHDARGSRHIDVPAGWVAFDTVLDRIHPDDRGALDRQLEALFNSATSDVGAMEFRAQHRDGSEHWLAVHAGVVFEGAGEARRPIFSYGTTRDITARKQAERAIARFISASPSVIYAIEMTPTGFMFRWSSGNEESVTGWTSSEAAAPGWWERNLHPDDRDRVFASQHSMPSHDHLAREFRFRRKDGAYIWIHDEQRLVPGPPGSPTEIVGSWSDVTARVQLEDQLRQSQKLEAVGQLAGGVAHDFNNLLTVIAGNCELLATQLAPDSIERQRLGEIRDAGRRAAGLTRQLLAFSRSQLLEPRVVELNLVLSRVEAMLLRLIGEDVTLTCHLSPEAGQVNVDPGQLEQVIVNLAVNARDAMPDGGQLTIDSDRVTLDGDFCQRHPDVVPGVYVRLKVTDSGTGMTPEVKAHIFEPFFTTKPVGKGTGLGLSTVFGIIKQSGGHIDVESNLGHGTSVHIFLPAVAAAPRTVTTGGEAGTAAVHGHETVLLVEDEASVRRLAHLALERHGYRVLVAENGRHALEVAELHRHPIDLVITDVIMPEMSGRQLADVLRRRWPAMKVLFMSGYIQDALERHDVVREPFLGKPFTLTDFATAVRRVIDHDPHDPAAG